MSQLLSLPDSLLSEVTPHDVSLNLRFRRMLLEAGYSSPALASEIHERCENDILFFIDTFCWLLEARKAAEWQIGSRFGDSKELPFITRPYQRAAILKAVENLGTRDIVIPKSRETGVTWIFIAIAVWDWAFHGQTHIAFVSKDMLSADNPDDPDSLFSKFLFLLKRLPEWLRPPYERNINNHTLKNLDNESSVTAYAATANIARGGRKTWCLMDEFHAFKAGEDYGALDSTAYVSHSRVFISTVSRDRGQAGAFYDMVIDDTHNGVQIVIDWKDDEAKRCGLYHAERSDLAESHRLVIDDHEFWDQFSNGDGTYRHPSKQGQNYSFILDDRVRSLYYDHQWHRPGSTPQSIAAELDRDFGGATSQIFSSSLASWALDRVKPAMFTGDLNRDPDKPNSFIFDPMASGGLTTLWCDLENGRPPEGEYAAGADIAAGTGGEWSSYSALEVFDKRSGEQVFEWRSNRVDPLQFGELAVWVCKWFWNAYLVPESNGPLGQLFLKRAYHELHYGRIYHNIRRGFGTTTTTDVLGYRNQDRGIELLKTLEAAVRAKRVFVNSSIALREAGRYFLKGGKLVHAAAEVTEDGAGMGLAHGDAAIALSAAVLGLIEWPASELESAAPKVPESCFLARRERYLARQRQRGNVSYWNAR